MSINLRLEICVPGPVQTSLDRIMKPNGPNNSIFRHIYFDEWFKSRRFWRSVGFGSGISAVIFCSLGKGLNQNGNGLYTNTDKICARDYRNFRSRIWKATLKNFGVQSLGLYGRSGIDKVINSNTDVGNTDKGPCQSLKPSCIRIVCMELVFRIRLRYILSR